ncbi:MAG TPA: alpha/beta family hydrolase [Candidatus Limnocylindrales bacterium]|nr:alpha/beta family hydrolase [Candidatus Limnocylindrales bacterium]
MRVYLGHGAAGTAASMAPFVDGLRRRGIDATAIDLPKRRAEEAVPALLRVAPPGPSTVVGGHSYGGRVASLAAAGQTYAGLVLLSFPLHRPGHPELGPRVAHFPRIGCRVLLLSGEADPFARLDLLQAAVERLPRAELVTYPRLGHTLLPALDDALDRVARFVRELEAAPAGDV